MRYAIELAGLEFRSPHGCYDVEQLVGGNFRVDLVLEVEDNGAASADDIGSTVNYVEVYEIVRREMAVPSRIIENVASRILDALSARFPSVLGCKLTIAKLAPPIGGKAAHVAVTFTFDR